MKYAGRSVMVAVGKSGGWFFRNNDIYWHLGLGCVGITWWRCDVEELLLDLLKEERK